MVPSITPIFSHQHVQRGAGTGIESTAAGGATEVGATKGASIAQHPLHAQLGRIGLVDLHDQARPAPVHGAGRAGRSPVAGCGTPAPAPEISSVLVATSACTEMPFWLKPVLPASIGSRRLGSSRCDSSALLPVLACLRLRRLRRCGTACIARQWRDAFIAAHCRRIALPGNAAQHAGELIGLGIAQVDHMQVAGLVLGAVQLLHQLPRQTGAAGALERSSTLLLRGSAITTTFWLGSAPAHPAAARPSPRRPQRCPAQLHYIGVHAGRSIDAGDNPCDAPRLSA